MEIKLTHKLTDPEGVALANLAIALRPDWSKNNPGKVIHDHQAEHGHLIQADSFVHAVQALIVYATGQGVERKRTPNLYVADGRHWESTRPTVSGWDRRPACQEHPEEAAHNCRCCWSEVKTGDRAEDMIGKRHPTTPLPPPPDGMTRWQYLMQQAREEGPLPEAPPFTDEPTPTPAR